MINLARAAEYIDIGPSPAGVRGLHEPPQAPQESLGRGCVPVPPQGQVERAGELHPYPSPSQVNMYVL